MDAYEDLEEERDALREEVEGLRASARQLKTTLAQAVANEAAEREENAQLKLDLAARDMTIIALQQEVEALKGQVTAAQGRIPSHPPGLCQEATCEFCVAQAQEIAEPAYAKGREDLIAHIDEALVAVGGEPLRERVAAVLAQGHAIVERGKQEIVIVDDKGEPLPGEVVLQAVDKAVREALKQAEPQMRAFLQQRQQVATVVP